MHIDVVLVFIPLSFHKNLVILLLTGYNELFSHAMPTAQNKQQISLLCLYINTIFLLTRAECLTFVCCIHTVLACKANYSKMDGIYFTYLLYWFYIYCHCHIHIQILPPQQKDWPHPYQTSARASQQLSTGE